MALFSRKPDPKGFMVGIIALRPQIYVSRWRTKRMMKKMFGGNLQHLRQADGRAYNGTMDDLLENLASGSRFEPYAELHVSEKRFEKALELSRDSEYLIHIGERQPTLPRSLVETVSRHIKEEIKKTVKAEHGECPECDQPLSGNTHWRDGRKDDTMMLLCDDCEYTLDSFNNTDILARAHEVVNAEKAA